MTNNEIRNILNTVYEIEGIAEMAQKLPEGEKRDAFSRLIADKCYMLANMVAELGVDNLSAPKDMGWIAPVEPEPAEPEQSTEEPEQTADQQVPEPQSDPHGIPAVLEDDVEVEIEKEVQPEPVEEPEEPPVSIQQEMDEKLKAGDIFDDDDDDDDEPEPDEEEDEDVDIFGDDTEPEEEDDEPSRHKYINPDRGDIRKLFTISDKFRFTRELFGNKPIEYHTHLELIMTMEDYSQAEEYFYEDQQWDADSPDVADFMAILRRYFSD